jgi:hypothetical protein
MSWNEPGPRYYYNDPSGSPYHDPSWYKRPESDDKRDNQKEFIIIPKEEEDLCFDLTEPEILVFK